MYSVLHVHYFFLKISLDSFSTTGWTNWNLSVTWSEQWFSGYLLRSGIVPNNSWIKCSFLTRYVCCTVVRLTLMLSSIISFNVRMISGFKAIFFAWQLAVRPFRPSSYVGPSLRPLPHEKKNLVRSSALALNPSNRSPLATSGAAVPPPPARPHFPDAVRRRPQLGRRKPLPLPPRRSRIQPRPPTTGEIRSRRPDASYTPRTLLRCLACLLSSSFFPIQRPNTPTIQIRRPSPTPTCRPVSCSGASPSQVPPPARCTEGASCRARSSASRPSCDVTTRSPELGATAPVLMLLDSLGADVITTDLDLGARWPVSPSLSICQRCLCLQVSALFASGFLAFSERIRSASSPLSHT